MLRSPDQSTPNRKPRFLSRWTVLLVTLAVVITTHSAVRSGAQSQTGGPAAAKQTTPGTGQPTSGAAEPEVTANAQPAPGDVIIDGRKVLSVYQSIGHYSAKDRAERITERILTAAKDGADPESVVVAQREAWSEISVGSRLLLAISDEDARLAGKTRAQLADEYAQSIRQTLQTYRREHSWNAILRGIGYSLLVTIALLPIVFIIRKFRLLIRAYVEGWIEKRTRLKEEKTAVHVSMTYLASSFLAVGSVMRWLVLIVLFEVYLTVILSFFPYTRSVSHTVTDWILSALQAMGDSALIYLPNLFVIAVVALIANQIFRLIKMVFGEIGKGNLKISGFYPEWAEPSAKLIRLMVLALVIIIIFPYLPGSKSPAFQGISIFMGVLLSLGSSSAVANVIAGIILTYMRSFSVGDWVRIGDTVGEVEEKSLLVTRIITPKQEIITIPNATVMSGSVMNYTRQAKNAGVIFHTTVTIGYDAPWKTVHQLLIDAAHATEHVLSNPAPFVLQTQLNDFYVSYELNAYTDVPRRMQFIYSDLHQNIQDRFNEAGVEICSPHFSSLRDGNTMAIPERYIPSGYTAPSFRVDGKEQDARQTAGSRK